MKAEAEAGLVLLVCNALPPEEDPADPGTKPGMTSVVATLEEALIEQWDEMISRDTSLPVLLVSFPGYSEAVEFLFARPIARQYGADLLKHLSVPTDLIGVMLFRREFLAWIHAHGPDMLMIKPFTSFGAKLDRSTIRGLAELGSGEQAEPDPRPLTVEVVKYDGAPGPLLGITKKGGDPRPALMPSSDWRAQGYTPGTEDQVATGVLYLDLRITLREVVEEARTRPGLTVLDRWSMQPLMEMSSAGFADQPAIIERALATLLETLRARPLYCPPERAVRGLRGEPIF